MAADVEDELGNDAAALRHYADYYKLLPDATDIPDEYYRRINPKGWERMEKEREKQRQEEAKAREEKKAETEKAEADKNAPKDETSKPEAAAKSAA